MRTRTILLSKIAVCVIACVTTAATTVWAGTPDMTLTVPKTLFREKAAGVNPHAVRPVSTEVGEIEIVTDLSGKHYWQVAIRNTGNHEARNFKVIVNAEGFRKEDKVQTLGVIERLKAGETAYARAELPDFEGMHRLRVKAGGRAKTVELPRPFRKDANGNPLSGLEIEKAWVHTVAGKIRWYFKTKPNLYAAIKPNAAQFGIFFRERKHKACFKENFGRDKRITYLDPASPVGGAVTNPKEIKPGESITLSGELNEQTAKPYVPRYVDQLMVEGLNLHAKKWQPLDTGYYPASWQKCTE